MENNFIIVTNRFGVKVAIAINQISYIKEAKEYDYKSKICFTDNRIDWCVKETVTEIVDLINKNQENSFTIRENEIHPLPYSQYRNPDKSTGGNNYMSKMADSEPRFK